MSDDRDTASVLVSALTGLGYAVELAPDGKTGLAKILANRPDLVLCELSVLRRSGLEMCLDLLEQLSDSRARYAPLPLILLTDERDRDSECGGRRLRKDDCVTKPVDLKRLRIAVENRLRRVAAGRDL
jgi:DNA-binding response OmpR family regulator